MIGPSGVFDEDDAGLFRAGGIAGMALGAGYIVIVPVYLAAGTIPTGGGAEWLAYLADRTTVWWWIAGLSVVTDLFYLPLAAALYVRLRHAGRNQMLTGAALLTMFVVLDLALTWPNYASLISLSGGVGSVAGTGSAGLVAAADYAVSIVDSRLFGVYAIGVPALGILAIGLVMLRSGFGRFVGWTAVLTGVVGIASVVGPFFSTSLELLAVPTSVLTTVWALGSGYRLLRPTRRADLARRG